MKPNVVLMILLLLVAVHLVVPISPLILVAIGAGFGLYKGYTSQGGFNSIFKVRQKQTLDGRMH
ncbi:MULTISPECIES: hypothetical protein [Exiguobacterium]|uniref:Uncharacterized protein n=1 Tax=Exiguobacterium antarcticum TaxID=132920 RepID=A0ABT6R3E1_9BACL|nr:MULTISPECIES: hypothetical protein [Exiguobacterium]MCT4779146.1 hypothetical protein [Exiguobacterium soli]MDI3234821.1 hypothetical protein [Exiguobacterium antarcticum]